MCRVFQGLGPQRSQGCWGGGACGLLRGSGDLVSRAISKVTIVMSVYNPMYCTYNPHLLSPMILQVWFVHGFGSLGCAFISRRSKGFMSRGMEGSRRSGFLKGAWRGLQS